MHGYTLGILNGLSENIEYSNHDIYNREGSPDEVTSIKTFYEDIYLNTSDNSGSKIIHGPRILGLDPHPYTGGSGIERGTVVIYGDLQVLGETTTVESNTLIIKDKIIRVETAPGEAGGMQIVEIDRANNTENEIGSFTFIKRGNLIEWSTDSRNLNLGSGSLITNEIKSDNFREQIRILDISA